MQQSSRPLQPSKPSSSGVFVHRIPSCPSSPCAGNRQILHFASTRTPCPEQQATPGFWSSLLAKPKHRMHAWVPRPELTPNAPRRVHRSPARCPSAASAALLPSHVPAQPRLPNAGDSPPDFPRPRVRWQGERPQGLKPAGSTRGFSAARKKARARLGPGGRPREGCSDPLRWRGNTESPAKHKYLAKGWLFSKPGISSPATPACAGGPHSRASALWGAGTAAGGRGGERRSPRSPQHRPRREDKQSKRLLCFSASETIWSRGMIALFLLYRRGSKQNAGINDWPAAPRHGAPRGGSGSSEGERRSAKPGLRIAHASAGPGDGSSLGFLLTAPSPPRRIRSVSGRLQSRTGFCTGWHWKAVNREERKGNSYGLHVNGAQRRAPVPLAGSGEAALASPWPGGHRRWTASVCVLRSLWKKAGEARAAENFPLQTAIMQRTRVKMDNSVMLQLRPLLSGQYQTTAAIKIPRQIPSQR